VKSLCFKKEKNQELQEENTSHVDAVNATQTREDSGPNADGHLSHEFIATGDPTEGPPKAEIPKCNDSFPKYIKNTDEPGRIQVFCFFFFLFFFFEMKTI